MEDETKGSGETSSEGQENIAMKETEKQTESGAGDSWLTELRRRRKEYDRKIEEVQEFMNKKRLPPTKERILTLFCGLHGFHRTDDITWETIKSIDLSRLKLSSIDVEAVGFVINHCPHLEMVNLHACKLPSASLQRIVNQVDRKPKIDKFRVTSNPNLTLDDYKAGIRLCAKTEASFVYDASLLPVKDRKILMAHARHHQPQDKEIGEKSSKQRRRLMKEERFQKIYKKATSGETRLQRVSLQFGLKGDSDLKEQPENESEIGESSTSAAGTHVLRNNQPVEKEAASSNIAEDSQKQIEENPAVIIEDEGSLTRKKKTRPRTLNEIVKMKPVLKFKQTMDSFAKDGKLPAFENRGDHVRMLKGIAMASDRRRFESVTLKEFAPQLQSYVRKTQNEGSTIFKKSSKGDSGYRTKSSFSDMLSSKGSRRRYTRMDDQGTEMTKSIESTKPASLERIDEEGNSADQLESCDSGYLVGESMQKKHEYDPRKISEQKLEMTRLGLGITQKKKERIEDWFKTAEFDVIPPDLALEVESLACGELHEKFVLMTLNSIDEEIRDVMGDILQRVERNTAQEQSDESEIISSEISDNGSEGSTSIEEIVDDVVEDLLWKIEENEFPRARGLRNPHTIDDFISRINTEVRRLSKRKAYRTRKIGPEGGSIDLYGCQIIIPPTAVSKMKDIKISVDNNPKNFPKFLRAISPILSCVPTEFNVPVTVRLTTWFSAKKGRKVLAKIMKKGNLSADWKEVRSFPLGEKNVVEYKTTSFCGHVAVTQGEKSSDIKCHLMNGVWMHRKTASILSLFCKDQKALKSAGRSLKRYHRNLLSLPKEITVSIGNTIAIDIECSEPPAMQISSIGENTLAVNNSTLEDTSWDLYFKPKPHPKNMQSETEYDVMYRVKVLNSSGELIPGAGFSRPLQFYWTRSSKKETEEGGSQPSKRVYEFRVERDMFFGGRNLNVDNSQGNTEPPEKRPTFEDKKDDDGDEQML